MPVGRHPHQGIKLRRSRHSCTSNPAVRRVSDAGCRRRPPDPSASDESPAEPPRQLTLDDSQLIDAVRRGDLSTYGELYRQHVAAAHNMARQLTRCPSDADDLVAEAFVKVMDAIRHGRGPDVYFRAYLLASIRHLAYDRIRRDHKQDPLDTVDTNRDQATGVLVTPFVDTAVANLERTLAAQAFARLPERWQAVLWHTAVEGETPSEVAPILGLTPNGVSALAYRAREGLRQAYLQVHLAEPAHQHRRCRAAGEKLGAWTRGGLRRREKAQVQTHLDECDSCHRLATELKHVNEVMDRCA